MRAVIVYDTLHGNTEQIANAIAEGFAGVGEVVSRKAADARPEDIQSADILVAGCPVHGWNISMPMIECLDSLGARRFEGMPAAAFDTKFRHLLAGGAAKKIAARLKKLGFSLIADPQSFFVSGMKGPLRPGELDRARAF
ncbi:MAG: flavodoxin domain-containing protein, partial [Armatimonadetes bacterium]|nr:flavodoxin domain-containing protein [Armatimonadota bacterium]